MTILSRMTTITRQTKNVRYIEKQDVEDVMIEEKTNELTKKYPFLKLKEE